MGRPAPETTSVAAYGNWVGYWPETGSRIQAHEWAAARALVHGEVVRNELFENERFGDGKRRLILNNAAPVRDARGAIIGAVVAQLDVTASRAAEEELRRTSELLRLIGDSAPDLIYAKDRESRMLYANAAFRQVAGRTADQLMSRPETEWAPDRGQAEAFAANDRRVIKAGVTLDLDEVFTGLDGRTRHFRAVKAPLREASGRIIGLVGVSSDVTERREAEERERLLAREVDHRAKNMLMVIQSMVQLSRAEDVAALKAAVAGRIQALARAHSLPAASRWEGWSCTTLWPRSSRPSPSAARGSCGLKGPPSGCARRRRKRSRSSFTNSRPTRSSTARCQAPRARSRFSGGARSPAGRATAWS